MPKREPLLQKMQFRVFASTLEGSLVFQSKSFTELYQQVGEKCQQQGKLTLQYMGKKIQEKSTLLSIITNKQGRETIMPVYTQYKRWDQLIHQMKTFQKDKERFEFRVKWLNELEREFVKVMSHELFLESSDFDDQTLKLIKGKEFQTKSMKKIWQRRKYVTEGKIPRGVSEIIPDQLFLGSGLDANNFKVLQTHKIQAILNCSKEWKKLNHSKSISYKHLQIEDTEDEDIFQVFEEAHEFIHQQVSQKSRILIHCTIGKSRSAAIVISYLMKAKSMKLKDAYSYTQQRRNLIRPNDAFIQQLQRYETRLFRNQIPSLSLDELPKPLYKSDS